MPFEENEISSKSNGGTELQMRSLTGVIDPELLSHFQIISSRPRELQEDKIRIMFFHDLAGDPEVANFRDQNYRNKFHHNVFISDWQYQQFVDILKFPMTVNSSVIEVGFDPIEVDWEAKKSETIRFCYTSTPNRGLEILIPVFDHFSKHHPDVHLDVFSSFKIYGWDDMDRQYETFYNDIRKHPQMTYQGFVPNSDLKDYLSKAHVFAYPCIWPETSCKAMEEAMSAGLLCVHPNFAALPLTSGLLNQMYPFDRDKNVHGNILVQELEKAYDFIKNNPRRDDYLRYVKFYADNRYNLSRIKILWENLLTNLLARYPTPESRKWSTDNIITIDTNSYVNR